MTVSTSTEVAPAPAIKPPHRQSFVSTGSSSEIQTYRSAVFACAAVCILTGLAVLVGWRTGNEALMTVLPGHVRMKSNAAACFIAAALALLGTMLPARAGRLASRSLAAMVFLCGLLTLVEYTAATSFHLDELLFRDPVQRIFPGRMAFVSALNFLGSGSALFLLTGSRRKRLLAQCLALAVVFVSYVAIVGYTYGVPTFYGSVTYKSMALHTGAAFILLAVGILLAPHDSVLAGLISASERGSWIGRRLLPAMLLLPPLLGWLYLRPAVSFASPAFAMALFAVTLALTGTVALFLIVVILNREQRQLAAIIELREESAATVRQSEQELRLITDHLPTLLSYIDADGRYVRVNRTYERWIGLPGEAIVGRYIRDILGEDYWESTASARAAVLSGQTTTFETAFPTLQGRRQAQVTYAPDIDNYGRVRGIACLVLDVHDRRSAEAALQRSEKLAVVGRLASSIAHEINNPLEAVMNLLYLAAQDTAADPETALYLNQAQQELMRVTHIVTQTLRFHRQASLPTRCHLSTIVKEVLSLYQGRLAQANIPVQLRFRDAEPVLCHEGEIRQVLANLIGNAADAMATGGRLLIRTTSAVDRRTGRRGVRVSVADTGHGIPETARETLFEPFHSTKGDRGSGLGLWISKEIVDRHHGRLRLSTSTRPGKSGTVFSVELFPTS